MSNRKTQEGRILKLAREIAATGRHNGWFHVAMELKLDRGEPLADQILGQEPHRSDLDRRCAETRLKMFGPPGSRPPPRR